MFDLAYTALLEDLKQRGLLDTTLVVAMGEFGRTPQLNPRGGRDHWPGVWSVLFAGAGVRGGQVVGASDKTGAEPKDRPVTPAEVAATVYHGLGVDLDTRLPGPEGRPMPVTEAEPVRGVVSGVMPAQFARIRPAWRPAEAAPSGGGARPSARAATGGFCSRRVFPRSRNC